MLPDPAGLSLPVLYLSLYTTAGRIQALFFSCLMYMMAALRASVALAFSQLFKYTASGSSQESSLPVLYLSLYTTAGRIQALPCSGTGSEARLMTPGAQATGPCPHTELLASDSLGQSMRPAVIGLQGLAPSSLTIGLATYCVGCFVQQARKKCW